MPAYNLMILNPETNEFELSTDCGGVPHLRLDPGADKYDVTSFWNAKASRHFTEAEAKLVVWADPEWRDRETRRFRRGIYQALPWTDLEPIEDHFAHVSMDDGAKIAFTEDNAKGMVDRQTRIKPGRYLKKFYPHLTSDVIRELAADVDKAGMVRYAKTPDDIERVYLNGPNSCMSHPANDYESSEHPIRIYGDSDLQLAYLSSLDITHDDFRASSRALVWPEHKVYVRIYGDETRMKPALELEGYKHGDFQGAKIRRVLHDDTDDIFVVPYLDCGHRAEDHGTHLVIDRDGDVNCETTTGLTEDDRNFCEYYEERTRDEVFYLRDTGMHYSQTAIDNGHAFRCAGNGRYYSENAPCHEVGGDTYSEDYLESYGFFCQRSEEWFLDRDDIAVTLTDTDETVALSWLTDASEDSTVWHDETTDLWYAMKPSEAFLAEQAGQLRLALEAKARGFHKGDRVSGTWGGTTLTGAVVSGPDREGDYLVQVTDGSVIGFTQDGVPNCWYVKGNTMKLLSDATEVTLGDVMGGYRRTAQVVTTGPLVVGDVVRCVRHEDTEVFTADATYIVTRSGGYYVTVAPLHGGENHSG